MEGNGRFDIFRRKFQTESHISVEYIRNNSERDYKFHQIFSIQFYQHWLYVQMFTICTRRAVFKNTAFVRYMKRSYPPPPQPSISMA